MIKMRITWHFANTKESPYLYNNAPLAQLDRAQAYEAWCHWFESSRVCQFHKVLDNTEILLYNYFNN